MKYPEWYLINFMDLYTQLCWQLPQLYDKSGSHQSWSSLLYNLESKLVTGNSMDKLRWWIQQME